MFCEYLARSFRDIRSLQDSNNLPDHYAPQVPAITSTVRESREAVAAAATPLEVAPKVEAYTARVLRNSTSKLWNFTQGWGICIMWWDFMSGVWKWHRHGYPATGSPRLLFLAAMGDPWKMPVALLQLQIGFWESRLLYLLKMFLAFFWYVLDIYLALLFWSQKLITKLLLGFLKTVVTWSGEICERSRRLARYVDEALVAAERDVESSPDEETRYARHRKYFRRTGLEWLERNQKRVIMIDDETSFFSSKVGVNFWDGINCRLANLRQVGTCYSTGSYGVHPTHGYRGDRGCHRNGAFGGWCPGKLRWPRGPIGGSVMYDQWSELRVSTLTCGYIYGEGEIHCLCGFARCDSWDGPNISLPRNT